MGKLAVFIYDNSDERRISLANAFRGVISTTQFFRNAHGDLCTTEVEIAEHEEVDALCCLVHVRDRRMLQDNCPSGSHLVVYYGGNGGEDKDIPKDAVRIWRPLLFTSGVLTGTEARELVNYATHLRSGSVQSTRPVFLLPPSPSPEFCAFLAMLCQGMLAHYAITNLSEEGVETKGCTDLRKALKCMGWVEDEEARKVSQAVKELGLCCTPTDSKQPDPNADFWKSPFEGQKEMLKKALQNECSPLRAKVETKFADSGLRWLEKSDLPESTRQLVDAIDKSEVSGDSFVGVVAGAYLELNLLLECAGC